MPLFVFMPSQDVISRPSCAKAMLDHIYHLMVKFIEASGQLGEFVILPADILKSLEEFVCAMYGSSNIDDVNIARFHIFSKLCAPKDPHQPLNKIKLFVPCCIPPCRPVLLEKVKRSNYVDNLWKHAAMPRPTEIEPAGHGWLPKSHGHTIQQL